MAISLSNSTAIETAVLTASNQSTVSINITVSWDGGSWAADNPRWYMKIDGVTKASGTANFNTNEISSGSQAVASRSFTIDHNSDGKKTISWEVGYEGVYSGEGRYTTKTGSLTLTNIELDNAWVNTYGGWKKGRSYIKTNDGWKKGDMYIRTESGWKKASP